MNSYMRPQQQQPPAQQAPSAASEHMHSFLKDKQAWENAIAMYQGPDPLDHWYNYICWYENHGTHGDPENKFRETLERCLTLYEHSDYYKQDARMVRLWLKYIDMQANPLHFYQVLHKRGVGRQIASFYISWAAFYESENAFKEAESVFNLAFQQKAQPVQELQHAHGKLMYTRSQQQQQAQQQQLKMLNSQQPHMPAQSTQPQQAYGNPPHQQQAQQPHVHMQNAVPHSQQHTQVPASYRPVQQTQQQVVYQQQQAAPAHPSQQLYQQHVNYHPQTQQQHAQIQQQQSQQQHVVQHNAQQHVAQIPTQQHVQYNAAAQQVNYLHGSSAHQSQHVHVVSTVPIEQPLPAVAPSPALQQLHQQQMQQQQQPENHQTQTTTETPTVTPSTSGIEGCCLPRNFATYCQNNYETWRPALFLEEPDDPSRRCHYAKKQVYPAGMEIEYCPEELKAKKYKLQQEARKQQEQPILPQDQLQKPQSEQQQQVVEIDYMPPQQLQEIGHIQRVHAAPQQQNVNHVYYQQQQHPQQQHSYLPQQQYDVDHQHHHHHTQLLQLEAQQTQPIYQNHANQYQDTEEEDEEEEDETADEEAEEDDAEYEQLQTSAFYQQQQQQHIPNMMDDLEDQIEASTIRFSTQSNAQEGIQNKTLKIKFKKERSANSNTHNGNNYSAYTIESSYQKQISSPSTPHQAHAERRNGYSFHPYMLGQTSTPKTSSKRSNKSKIKRINHNNNKFNINHSNSNSSSAFDHGVHASTPNGANYRHNSTLHNATFNDNANYSFSSAVALDNSNCSISSAVGRLNFRDAGVNNSNVVADISTYQENSYFATQHDEEARERRLQKALEAIDRHLAKEAIDPFNTELCKAFLTKLNFPGNDDDHAHYKIVQMPLPKIQNNRTLSLPNGVSFSIDKEVGRGSYGSVYKATEGGTGAVVALKFQKPPNSWEIYICDQVLKRIQSPNILPGLMDISTAIIAPNASLIATEFSSFGSLLDINNKIRQATSKVMHESLVMHFSSQICNIISHLHRNQIIHADIKPDNFLLMRVPNTDLHFPSLRLIDFGCAIDMTLFPEETKFRKVIQTDGFTCIEMQEGRAWSYETDLFCIAGTVHVMLMGEYMQLQKRAGTWDIKQKLPRYLKKNVWTKFFGEMLNIKASKLPELIEMRDIFEEEAAKMDSELQKQIRALSNILHRR